MLRLYKNPQLSPKEQAVHNFPLSFSHNCLQTLRILFPLFLFFSGETLQTLPQVLAGVSICSTVSIVRVNEDVRATLDCPVNSCQL